MAEQNVAVPELQAQPELATLQPLALHHFRCPRARWARLLMRARQLGANAVSTAVPWAWHQPAADVLDVAGVTHPGRDLLGFLAACKACGLAVVLEIGPYLDLGLLNGGLPAWLLQRHPEVYALDRELNARQAPDGSGPLPSPEHPIWLRTVEEWYRQLATHLADHQAPDGPIVALRVNHAPGGAAGTDASASHVSWDYNPHVTRVLWPVWLRQRYANIQALNAAWGSDFRSFNDAAFPSHRPPGEAMPQPHADAIAFAEQRALRAAATYRHLASAAGWRVPVFGADQPPPWPEPAVVHLVQVDPDLPRLGSRVCWAEDAPLYPDGSARRRFWVLKEAGWGLTQGRRQVADAWLVSGADSRGVPLPPLAPAPVAYRLLLDGQLSDVTICGDPPEFRLDYRVEDELGQTDMYLVLPEGGALPPLLQDYLAALLSALACGLHLAAARSQALAEGLADVGPAGEGSLWSAVEELRAARHSLEQARQAVRRAAMALGKLEAWTSQVPLETTPVLSDVFELSGVAEAQRQGLNRLQADCREAARRLTEAAQAMVALPASQLSLASYREAWQQSQLARQETTEQLGHQLTWLRAQLVAGSLPTGGWQLHERLAELLDSLRL